MAPLRFAIVGLGGMGMRHARALARIPDVELIAAADINPDAGAPWLADVFTTDVDAALARTDIDALIVATPNHLHRDFVVSALSRGVHVLCEKPIATSLADVRAIGEAAEASSAVFVAGHIQRADPRYRAIRAKLASGDLGRVVHCYSRRNYPRPVAERYSSITTLPMLFSIHDIDVLQWLIQSDIVSVYGQSSDLTFNSGPVAATVVAVFRFADGSVGLHEACWALPEQTGLGPGNEIVEIVATEGCAYLEGRSSGVTFLGGVEAPIASSATQQLRFTARGTIEKPWLDGAYPDVTVPLLAEDLSFVAAVRGEEPPLTSAREAESSVLVALAFEQSIATGLPVQVVRRQEGPPVPAAIADSDQLRPGRVVDTVGSRQHGRLGMIK
jgi:predicted dehydrogenase